MRTPLPPLLVEREGAWFIELMLEGGQQTVLAPLGDGAWLVQQLVEKLVLPRLREPPSPYRLAPLTADENAARFGYADPYEERRDALVEYERVVEPFVPPYYRKIASPND